MVVLSCWTSILLVFNTPFDSEIKNLLTKMYLNQKVFLLNVKDLSIILVKDANNRLNKNNLEFLN